MNISRRQFLILSAGAGAIAGCQSDDVGGHAAKPGPERIVNAGPVTGYAADGVYAGFRDLGFFVVRKRENLFAVSAICTHKKCKLNAQPDHSFYCKCHGSAFDPDGKVTKGPAKRDLPVFTTTVDEQGQLLVRISPG